MHYTATFRTHPPPQAAGTLYCPMDVDDLPVARGSRPDRLTEVRPQERVQRRTVEQIVPVPLMEEQLLVDAFAPHDVRVPEQVIEVPKILIDELPARTSVREPQLAEQLVEVPTILSFSSWQRTVEQNVDVPVPRGGARGLQGFLPGQASTTSSFSLERISERNVEQIADFPGGGLQDFLPGQSSSSSSHDPARAFVALDAPGYGGFRTFPRRKKSAKIGPHSGSELSADFISSTPSAYEKGHFSEDGNFFFEEEDQKTWMRLPSGRWYLLRSEPEEYRNDPRVRGEAALHGLVVCWFWRVRFLSGPPSHGDHGSFFGDWDVPSSCVSLRRLSEVCPVLCARAVRT